MYISWQRIEWVERGEQKRMRQRERKDGKSSNEA
jgi:hypothetical protein